MELRHLNYFVAVAEQLHFGRAAARLHIAQPSLSQQIRKLEADVGVELLRRSSRQVQLTDAGRLFLEEAREILAHASRAATVARRAARGEAGRLVIGFGPWMDCTAMPSIIATFGERCPNVQIHLRSLSTSMQIDAMRDRRLDIGFLRQPSREPWLRTEPLAPERFVAAFPLHHPLARGGPLDLSQLAGEPFVAFPRDTAAQLYDTIMQVCRHGGFVPRVRHEADNPATVLAMVASGTGVTLVPSSLRRTKHPLIVFRPIRGARAVLRTTIAWRRDTESPTVDTFLRIARDVMGGRRRRVRT